MFFTCFGQKSGRPIFGVFFKHVGELYSLVKRDMSTDRLDFEEANAAKLCEVRTLGLDYCSILLQARHHELDMPGVPSRKKRKAPASEETLKRQLRRWPKVKNDSISMSSDTSS